MAVAAGPVPLTGRSLLGRVAVAFAARARMKRQGASRVAAFIVDHAGTMATLGLVDTGLWHWSQIAGYIGAGVCVAVAELKIRG